jgi:hypothetical protein
VQLHAPFQKGHPQQRCPALLPCRLPALHSNRHFPASVHSVKPGSKQQSPTIRMMSQGRSRCWVQQMKSEAHIMIPGVFQTEPGRAFGELVPCSLALCKAELSRSHDVVWRSNKGHGETHGLPLCSIKACATHMQRYGAAGQRVYCKGLCYCTTVTPGHGFFSSSCQYPGSSSENVSQPMLFPGTAYLKMLLPSWGGYGLEQGGIIRCPSRARCARG